MRPALAGTSAAISPPWETSAGRRFFVFLDATILPDNKLINIALDDAYFLGLLSSRVHVTWALASGSHLGVGNDPVYVKTRLLRQIPLPRVHRRAARRSAAWPSNWTPTASTSRPSIPKLALTDMYNVLEKLRAGEP